MQQATSRAMNTEERKTIKLETPQDIRYWTQALHLSEEQLRLLVRMHGNAVAPIRAALNKRAA